MDQLKGAIGIWGYTKTDYIFIPEKQLMADKLPAEARLEPLRGYGFTLAVMVGDTCIGWCVKP